MRRLTILAVVAIIGASLALGAYFVWVTSRPSGMDRFDGQALSTTDASTLYHAALKPYGQSPGSGIGSITSYNGSPFTTGGKPIIVYIGAEYCQYCAVTRWGLILALERFGNFSGLEYMNSPQGEYDLATFTFVHTSYASNYFVFQGYEAADKNGNALSVPPSNYTTIWNTENHQSFPFVDFGNKYVLTASLITDPRIIQYKNWTQIFTSINNGDPLGQEIKQSANLVTAVLCKLTNGAPATVCNTSPINAITLAGPTSGALTFVSVPSVAVTPRISNSFTRQQSS